jgi:hypothetical protein
LAKFLGSIVGISGAVSLSLVSKPKRRVIAAKSEPFPWLLFLLLLASIYLFWILPVQIGTPVPRVEFSDVNS